MLHHFLLRFFLVSSFFKLDTMVESYLISSNKCPVATGIGKTDEELILGHSAQLARDLIRIESVTPNDNGCQSIIANRLGKIGFVTETMQFHGVTNLWAHRNGGEDEGPMVVFAGHTDVVSPGPVGHWTYPPFDGVVKDGMLYGRGAADMKGGIASFVTAVERFVTLYPKYKGTIGLIITSDEEGVARWGTREVISKLIERGTLIDMCIVGEPSSREFLGDIVKVGRRGSLEGDLTIHGIQGHIAYPHLAKNPIHESLAALYELTQMKWDDGNENFQPTSFQISNINSGTGAKNVIPGFKKVHFNFRYAPVTTDLELKERVKAVLDSHDLTYDIEWEETHYPFETDRGSNVVTAALASIQKVTGVESKACTSGGTSDGRFIAKTGAQVVELGPVSTTIHKVDECVATEDLETLSYIYEDILGRLLL